MGLDAVVCCNCFETGRLRVPPDPEWAVRVEEDGHLETSSESIDLQMAFDRWRMSEACDHEDCVLLHHYIGNCARVDNLRASLHAISGTLQIILKKVLYSGTHCGDWLDIPIVQSLQFELETIVVTHFSDARDEDRLRHFERQMRELAVTALSVAKPISF